MLRTILTALVLLFSLGFLGNAQTTPARGRPVLLHSEALAGTEILTPDIHAAFWGSPQVGNRQNAVGMGDTMEASWQHENPSGQVRPVVVRTEKRPGESIANWAERHGALVHQALEWYPPNVPGPSGLMAGGLLFHDKGSILPGPSAYIGGVAAAVAGDTDTMSVSWQHDTDGAGPRQPITVSTSTSKREGESSSQTARRLEQQAAALMEVFPPNVPPPSGG